MSLKSLLSGKVYYNDKLADALEHNAPELMLLQYELTWLDKHGKGSITDQMGVDFSNIGIENYMSRSNTIVEKYRNQMREEMRKTLDSFKLPYDNINLNSYLDAGQRAVEMLDFPYIRFRSEEVLAFMVMAKRQHRTFPVELHDLAIGGLAEGAMHDLLLNNKKEGIGRNFLMHNSDKPQDEKDVRIYTPDEQTLGVRCHRGFSDTYVYSKKRVFDERDKIADYVAFFCHFGHHIFYLIGIVEKDFLRKVKSSSSTKMEDFHMPEYKYEHSIIDKDFLHLPEDRLDKMNDAQKNEIVEHFKKRLSFDEFLKRLKDR